MSLMNQVSGQVMAKTHKIKQVIKSTKKTAVITQAMQVVSASKLPNAQKRLQKAKPFAELAESIMAHYSPCTNHPYFNIRSDKKKEGLIIISSDRGLCGNLNLGLFKQSLMFIKENQDQGIETVVSVVGSKAAQFFSKHTQCLSSVENIGDQPNLKELMDVIHPMITAFDNREIDKISIAGNKFKSTLVQQGDISTLLPLTSVQDSPIQHNYTFEPRQNIVIDTLLRHYVESAFYSAVIENLACEQAARMIAMKNATDNANDLIADLNLTYNKIRQASITQEIAEISSSSHLSHGEVS